MCTPQQTVPLKGRSEDLIGPHGETAEANYSAAGCAPRVRPYSRIHGGTWRVPRSQFGHSQLQGKPFKSNDSSPQINQMWTTDATIM